MRIIFTFDDGKKSQISFWNKVGIPGTYFILPEHTELKTRFSSRTDVDVCTWGEVRLLAKSNEIGFHGYSVRYEKWGDERTKKEIRRHLDLFKEEIGTTPVSYSYTNMQDFRISIIKQFFPYVRDYFWRDLKKIDNKEDYILRMSDSKVPDNMKPYRKKIFCMHPSRNPVQMFKRLKRVRDAGYEYCVIIFHDIDKEIILLGQLIGAAYDCITFREIFKKKEELK